MLFRRKEIPWEVVDSRSVDPVCMYYDDDSEDLEIVAIRDTSITRTYLLDVKHDAWKSAHQAVIFAREQLLQEAKKNGYNILWLESWRVTLLRKVRSYRVEVQYRARPARALNKVPDRHPPFMALLQTAYEC
ncbi:hypothetical protein BYT27DRAFT_7099497 [Phlegmacium glaucopus]|nr:hypothetical protein BYT27DRAFT_7099497 [Phlegmacium glaucopus]